jgi:hypothetical protein
LAGGELMLSSNTAEFCAWRPQMPIYRAFFFDEHRHIIDCREFDAGNHDLALDLARQWADGLLIEVWRGGELIGTVPPAPHGDQC